MTLSSAIDGEISNKEMQFIQTCINNLPIFKTYNSEDLEKTLSMFFELLSGDNDPETIIELIDQALDKKNKYIVVVAQEDGSIENPKPEDLYAFGTLAMVLKVFEMPDNSKSAIVQGVDRVKLLSFIET